MKTHVQTSPADMPTALPGLVHDNGEALSPQMELVTQLRVLLRCHDIARKAARSGMMRIFAVAAGLLSVPVAVVGGLLVYVLLDEGVGIDDEVAGVIGTFLGFLLGGGGLTLAFFLWSFLGRGREVDVPLDEQVRAIVHDHPGRVRAWGGPAVLRMPELAEEILRIEEERLAEPRPDPAG